MAGHDGRNEFMSQTEIELIKQAIQTGYVEGLQNEGDFAKIDQGIHPDFALLIPGQGNELQQRTLTDWKKQIQADLAAGRLPRQPGNQVSIKFLLIDVIGNAAVAKFDFYIGDNRGYVDYQFLYKFADGWKIVSKIYHTY